MQDWDEPDVASAKFLANGEEVVFTQEDGVLTLTLPEKALDPNATVMKLTMSAPIVEE